MPYKLIYSDKRLRDFWYEKGLQALSGIDYNKILAGTTIHLGVNPFSPRFDHYWGFYFYPNKYIVVNEKRFYLDVERIPRDMAERWALATLLHEIGHHVHYSYLGIGEPCDKWREWSKLTGKKLDFVRDEVKPVYEDFADHFRDWILGRRIGMEQFYMGLWEQEPTLTENDVKIFRAIMEETGKHGQKKLKKALERDNPRALVYL